MPDDRPTPAAGVPRPPPPCPICARPVVARENRPFCSARCRQVDLGRWLSGAYAIPGEPITDDPRRGAAEDEDDEGGAAGRP